MVDPVDICSALNSENDVPCKFTNEPTLHITEVKASASIEPLIKLTRELNSAEIALLGVLNMLPSLIFIYEPLRAITDVSPVSVTSMCLASIVLPSVANTPAPPTPAILLDLCADMFEFPSAIIPLPPQLVTNISRHNALELCSLLKPSNWKSRTSKYGFVEPPRPFILELCLTYIPTSDR